MIIEARACNRTRLPVIVHSSPGKRALCFGFPRCHHSRQRPTTTCRSGHYGYSCVKRSAAACLCTEIVFVATLVYVYYWRELPQAPFLPRQTFVATKKHVFVETKVSLYATKLRLSRQKFCHDKVCLSRQKFCRNKITFVATKDVFCRDRHVFVATKVFCDKNDICLP